MFKKLKNKRKAKYESNIFYRNILLVSLIREQLVKFNELEKKVFKFVCFLGCLIIKLLLESYDIKLMNNRDKSEIAKLRNTRVYK